MKKITATLLGVSALALVACTGTQVGTATGAMDTSGYTPELPLNNLLCASLFVIILQLLF